MPPTDRTGRNDPCPCGSGKKYKKCCLPKEQEARREAARPASGGTPVERALAWLQKRYRDEVAEAIRAHLELAGEDALERLRELPDDYAQMVIINVHEWLIADGDLAFEDRDVPVRDLLLGPGGPLFDAEGRAWIEALTSRPLGWYEVVDTDPGTGFRVRDLVHSEEPPVDVLDRSASKTLVRWEILALRLVPWKGDWVPSGAIYPFVRDADFPTVLGDLRDELARETEGDPDLERAFLSVVLPQEWLLRLLRPKRMPKMVDASTGDPILLVTDHYRVRDWESLEAVLADQPDVDGDRTDGWVRFEESGDGLRRPRLALNVKRGRRGGRGGRGDRLEVFTQTLRRADQGREWLEQVAGDALEHRTREMSDPAGALGATDGEGASSSAPPPVPVPTELVQELLESRYKDWADDHIPALGGKTPREAVRTPEGREAVIGLLKIYEAGEAHAALDESREPASFQFLWDAVGLDREEVLDGGKG